MMILDVFFILVKWFLNVEIMLSDAPRTTSVSELGEAQIVLD